MRKFANLGCIISVLFLSSAYAQVPRLVHYQGELNRVPGWKPSADRLVRG